MALANPKWVAGVRWQCPRVVALLAESYNPHMRYGAAMAVGIACAGTGLKEAIALLEPLTIDAVDYVRQGALIAMAMVLVQQTEVPRVAAFRKQVRPQQPQHPVVVVSQLCCATPPLPQFPGAFDGPYRKPSTPTLTASAQGPQTCLFQAPYELTGLTGLAGGCTAGQGDPGQA
jgi:hypothetical protein